MGWVLYSTKWVKHEPQKTHNTHTTTNMSGRRPTLQRLAPPPSPWAGQSFLKSSCRCSPTSVRTPASGEHRGVASAVELIDEKIRRIKYIVAYAAARRQVRHNNQPKTCGHNRGKKGHEARPLGSAGGARFDHFGDVRVRGG
jgi:hypothetical protein